MAYRSRLKIAVALIAFTLGACSRPVIPSDQVVIVQEREPLSLNPALDRGAEQTQWGMLLFNYLVKFDDRGRLIADVATGVPTRANGGISRDGKTITYHLRRGVRFADGTPLTARDCVYSIEAIQNPANNVPTRYGYDRIVRAVAPNDTTLVLHLREPFAPLFTVVLAPQGFPILPAHLLASHPNFNHLPFNEQPLGGGPYVVRHWYRGDRIELDANPRYFRGRPRIAHLTIRFVPDPNTAITQLRTREADVFFNDFDLGTVSQLQRISGTTVLLTPVNAVGALIFNTRDATLRDATVRRALVQAIDIPSVVAKTYHGAVRAAGAGGGLFQWAYDPRFPLNTRYDPARAKAILAHRHLHVQLAITTTLPGDSVLGNEIAQDERAAGVDLQLRAYPISYLIAPATLGGPVYGGRFQVVYWQFSNGDDPDVAGLFGCAYVAPHGYNISRFCDPQLDRLLEFARSTYDRAQRTRAYVSVQRVLTQRLPMALLYRRRMIDAYDARVGGISGSVSSIFWDVGSWYVKPARSPVH